jgi:hypothetical protein
MEHGYNVTGIPTDLLIMAVGALVSFIGAAMWRELHSLRKESAMRGRHITFLFTMMHLVCDKLNIPYDREDANGD